MDINALKQMNYEEVRHLYMPFLQSQGVGPNTIKTAYVDSFYLWRKGDHDLFWQAVEGSDADAKAMLLDVLRKNTSGDPEKLISFPHQAFSPVPRVRWHGRDKKRAVNNSPAGFSEGEVPQEIGYRYSYSFQGTGGVLSCQMGCLGELPSSGGCPG